MCLHSCSRAGTFRSLQPPFYKPLTQSQLSQYQVSQLSQHQDCVLCTHVDTAHVGTCRLFALQLKAKLGLRANDLKVATCHLPMPLAPRPCPLPMPLLHSLNLSLCTLALPNAVGGVQVIHLHHQTPRLILNAIQATPEPKIPSSPPLFKNDYSPAPAKNDRPLTYGADKFGIYPKRKKSNEVGL